MKPKKRLTRLFRDEIVVNAKIKPRNDVSQKWTVNLNSKYSDLLLRSFILLTKPSMDGKSDKEDNGKTCLTIFGLKSSYDLRANGCSLTLNHPKNVGVGMRKTYRSTELLRELAYHGLLVKRFLLQLFRFRASHDDEIYKRKINYEIEGSDK